MRTLRHIRVLSDGRAGHENQSVGLALALGRRTGAGHEVVRLGESAGVWTRMKNAASPGEVDLVIGAGHGTHLPLWWAARRLGARSVVIMRPSLPLGMFDLCLAPRHDFKKPVDRGNLVLTRGALNRVSEERGAKAARGLILLGGPSAHHGWAGEQVAAAVRAVMTARPELAWTVGDSRRTPEGFLEKLDAGTAERVSHRATTPDWLPEQLAAAREVWVTEDSVSMIFEAATAGARVGILPAPIKNPRARTVKAVQELVAAGYAKTFAEWLREAATWSEPPALHETARCADVVIERFFK